MLGSIFGKTLFEKRWIILIWFLAVLVSNFAISMIFPPIRDTMGNMLGQVPDSMKNWFGDASTWQTFEGFAGQEIFGQMTTVLVAMAIIFGAAFLAGEENDRTLLAVLSRPVSRLRVYTQKYLALVVFIAIVVTGFLVGAILGGLALSEPVPIIRFLECSAIVFLHSLALGSIAFSIGAITGKKALSGMIVGFYAFLAYFVQSLSTASSFVDKLSYGALYHYASGPETMAEGLNFGNIFVLSIAIIIPLAIAAPIFMRRDLQTK